MHDVGDVVIIENSELEDPDVIIDSDQPVTDISVRSAALQNANQCAAYLGLVNDGFFITIPNYQDKVSEPAFLNKNQHGQGDMYNLQSINLIRMGHL